MHWDAEDHLQRRLRIYLANIFPLLQRMILKIMILKLMMVHQSKWMKMKHNQKKKLRKNMMRAVKTVQNQIRSMIEQTMTTTSKMS